MLKRQHKRLADAFGINGINCGNTKTTNAHKSVDVSTISKYLLASAEGIGIGEAK